MDKKIMDVFADKEDIESSEEYCSCDKIDDKLYLADFYTVKSEDALKSLNIERVLSIVSTPVYPFEGILYKRIKAEDNELQNLLTTFPECIQFITEGHEYGQNVLVHCAAGISRSATIVIAFLMHKYKIPYKRARNFVSDKRDVHPNDGFVEQLKLFELMNYKIDANRQEYIDFLTVIERGYYCEPKLSNI